MAQLYISLLGSYQIELDGVPLSGFDSDKTRLLLAYLAVEAGKPHRRDSLVGLFWPEQPEASARRSLSQALYNLRQLLEKPSSPGETYILADSARVQFTPKSSDVVDVRLFNKLVTDCEKHDHRYLEACPECLERLEEANALYKGDFLADFPITGLIAFEEWVLLQREHLHRQALMMLKTLTQCYENRGQLQKAMEVARHQVELDPLWEAGQRRLMRLLALDGECNQALAGYEAFKRLLENELAVPPEKETRALAEQIRRDAHGEEALIPLPVAITPLIGRREALADVHCYLHDPACRLLTILGPGGSGKTRLALEEARRQQYQFKDGVYFIPLSALASPSSLMAVIAQGLGFTFGEIGDKKLQLLDYLRHKQVLLVLDSFETVVESAGLVAEMLSVSPTSKVLATSRVKLNLSGEQVYPLQGVEVPPQDSYAEVLSYPAAELFLEFAHRVNPGYQPEDVEGVAHICRLVEGMPLGLLLASSWVGDYPAREIAAQITHKLDFLAVEWSDLPQRQRSLRATYEYSWNLLSAHEQDIMMKLSVFRNSFTAQAAEQVAGASPQVLHALVGKSLLTNTGEGKYQMHDLVRQYSAAKLALAPSRAESVSLKKHADYFLERIEDWRKIFASPQRFAMLSQVDVEIADAQAAWEWASIEGSIEWLWLASDELLSYYSLMDRHQESEYACRIALEGIHTTAIDGQRLRLESRLLVYQANAWYEMGKVEDARQLIKLGQERLSQAEAMGLDIRSVQAQIWWNCAILTNIVQEKLDYLKWTAGLYQELGNPRGQASALTYAGEIVLVLADPRLAFELAHKALALSRDVGEPFLIAHALMHLAYVHIFFGPWEKGVQRMQEAVESYMLVGDIGSRALAEVHMAEAMGWSGSFLEACTMMETALVTTRQWAYRFLIMHGTMALGTFQLLAGQYDQASITLREALVLARQDDFVLYESHCQVYIGLLELVHGDSIQALDMWERCVVKYQQIGAIGMMHTPLVGVALAQHLLGKEANAWFGFYKGLQVASETHARVSLFILAPALVILLADANRWEQAVEAYTAVLADPIVSNSRSFLDLIGNRIELAREHLPEEVIQAAEARGREGDLFEVLGRLAQEIASWGVVSDQSQETVH